MSRNSKIRRHVASCGEDFRLEKANAEDDSRFLSAIDELCTEFIADVNKI